MLAQFNLSQYLKKKKKKPVENCRLWRTLFIIYELAHWGEFRYSSDYIFKTKKFVSLDDFEQFWLFVINSYWRSLQQSPLSKTETMTLKKRRRFR